MLNALLSEAMFYEFNRSGFSGLRQLDANNLDMWSTKEGAVWLINGHVFCFQIKGTVYAQTLMALKRASQRDLEDGISDYLASHDPDASWDGGPYKLLDSNHV